MHTAVGMLVAAALIGVASWIGKRWGASAGGWFVALPLISGPIVLTYALERGTNWVGSCALACGAFLASTWALQHFRAPAIGWTFVIACAVLFVALALMPSGSPTVRTTRSPIWDIPLRMILAATLVWLLASVSSKVGPRVSGRLTPFPITSTILVAFTHHEEGAASASQFLRGLLKGLFSFAVFVLVVGVAIGSWSIASTFVVATIVTIALHAGVWHWVHYPVPEPSVTWSSAPQL